MTRRCKNHTTFLFASYESCTIISGVIEMIGERLAAIRGDNDETQAELAEKLSVSVYTVRSWERNASAPSNEILVQICKMYGVSADYLLGLADYDPDYTRRLHQAKFTESERRELKKYEQYLLWKRKH